jgi:lysophospholipase L1-like esterase
MPVVGCETDSIPTVYLIGDSTVKTGRGNGEGGQYGWGQVINLHFDAGKASIVNQAIGGRSSRTFLTEGRWERVMESLKPGDFVLMQFGHNDGGQMFRGSRPRASIKGNGDETRDGVVENSGKTETVRSFGWYLRKYIAETKEKGAHPIVLSPIPRNIWRDGSVVRASQDYGLWAKQAAEVHDAFFIDLNEIVARRYESDGQDVVSRKYFTSADHTHTSKLGAEVNAECVVAGIRLLKECALNGALKSELIESPPSDTDTKTSWRFDFGSDFLSISR